MLYSIALQPDQVCKALFVGAGKESVKNVKDFLAVIGALVVLYFVFQWLVAAGVIHIVGGY